MHAGDGNVHVNVPVLSNDRPMLQRAEAVIDRMLDEFEAQGIRRRSGRAQEDNA